MCALPARLALVAALLAGAAVGATAQFQRGFFGARLAQPGDFDGQFHFFRLVYSGSRRGCGGNSNTDYPRADIHLSIRLSELTRTRVSFTAGQPNHLLVRPTADELFQCPFPLLSAPGAAAFDPDEASRLREYLLKAGFLWADNFWDTYQQWEQGFGELRKGLPGDRYPIVDVPLTHPLLRAQLVIAEIPQIPNIGYYLRSGDTSEQGADSETPHARVIADDHGLLHVQPSRLRLRHQRAAVRARTKT